MKDLLIKLKACNDARDWAADKTWEEVYTTCERGDWLLWLFFRTNTKDLQLLTLVKGHIANTVRHLIKDVRSTKAIDMAIAFGEGNATKEELSDVVAAAHAASDAASDIADDYAYAAAHAAASAAATAAYTATATIASDASDVIYAAYAASTCAATAAYTAYTAAYAVIVTTAAYAASTCAAYATSRDATYAANATATYAANASDVSNVSAYASAYAYAFDAYASADTSTDTSDAIASVKKHSLKQSADIVRKYIPIELWNINE